MKKTVLLFIAIGATLTSCSSEDSTPDDSSTDVLIKKIIFDYSENIYDGTITYTYNGNKLVEGNYNDGSKEKYYYNGNNIIKIEYLAADNELEYQELFSYNSDGKLSEYRAQDFLDDSEEKSLFAYNANSTITETQVYGEINNTNTTGGQSTLHVSGDELIKVEHLFPGGSTYIYSYDAKNSPFKNVTGYGAIALAAAGDHELFGNKQNISSIVDQTNSSAYTTNTNTYNSEAYPTSVISTAIFDADYPSEVETVNVQYQYQ